MTFFGPKSFFFLLKSVPIYIYYQVWGATKLNFECCRLPPPANSRAIIQHIIVGQMEGVSTRYCQDWCFFCILGYLCYHVNLVEWQHHPSAPLCTSPGTQLTVPYFLMLTCWEWRGCKGGGGIWATQQLKGSLQALNGSFIVCQTGRYRVVVSGAASDVAPHRMLEHMVENLVVKFGVSL